LRDKGLIGFDQQKFGNLSTIVAAILIDWHTTPSSLSLPSDGNPSFYGGDKVSRFFPNGGIEIYEIDDTRESQA
jgi:hypothetical protein